MTQSPFMLASSAHIRKILTALRRPRRKAAQKTLLRELVAHCGPLTDLRILDVGCDRDGTLVRRIASESGPSEIIGINLTTQDRAILPNAQLLRLDARATGFPDEYFDLIISYSAFEHIHDFPTALAELHRILKPNGLLYTRFGPIWSAPYGHHLWADGYTYWNLALPPWCHLLMQPDELRDHLLSKYRLPVRAIETVVNYVFEPSEEYGFSQNKLMFEDYAEIVTNSKFHAVLFKGYDEPRLDRAYLASVTRIEELNNRFPDYDNFYYSGIFMILKK